MQRPPKASHVRDYLVAAVSVAAEWASVKYGVAWLGWLAALFLYLALLDYTRSWFSGSERSRIAFRVLLGALVMGAAYQVVGLNRAPSVEPPHLQAKLMIDAVSEDVQFHIEVQNIGQQEIKDVRSKMQTSEMTDVITSVPVAPIIPAGGRISIPGLPNSGLNKNPVLIVDLDYQTLDDGQFTSHYSFIASPLGNSKEFLPTMWQEHPVKIADEQKEVMDEATKKLAGPQGTLELFVPLHGPGGSFNRLSISNGDKTFSFDAASRFVSFTIKGQMVKHEIPKGNYGAITVGCEWDNSKDIERLIIGGEIVP
jgi:hypothetical protein